MPAIPDLDNRHDALMMSRAAARVCIRRAWSDRDCE